ncbi:24255_t:CDS:2 [Gigaspora margarita]|uniref:24255_t:CDS:1 n=1 Tax=Gigaspora margarita TaxID=4874 RepID=A0ABM8VZJ1_GIGMA|nr:24255_t:CDS:2 [Gigaspora margarita]
MSSRTSKKHANKILNTNTANNKQKSKKSHTVDYGKKDIPVTSYKKKQDTVTPVVEHQTIDDILNSFDDNNEIEVSESS